LGIKLLQLACKTFHIFGIGNCLGHNDSPFGTDIQFQSLYQPSIISANLALIYAANKYGKVRCSGCQTAPIMGTDESWKLLWGASLPDGERIGALIGALDWHRGYAGGG
jgi:hypothetical protein